ncbi:MAG TPA: aquaporin [Actinomycetota bacterium]|nr:aquaporin [Actinomycetota bacterium]
MADGGSSDALEARGGVIEAFERRIGGELKDFYDPKFEGRRLFSEFIGTFFLVLVAAGGAVVNAQSGGQIPLAVRVTAPGLMVMAMILFMGAVSGAHFNPVVSVAFAMRGDFPWKRVPGYVIVQLIGSILAVLFLRATLGNIGGLGTTEPGPGITATTALIFEAVLTLGLLSTILGTASGAQNVGVFGAIGVGAYIALAGLWSAPISGTSMNPTRSLGPMIVSGNYHDWWVYIVGPFIGGVVAVGFAWILRGKGGGIRGKMAAQGDVKLDVADPSNAPLEAPPE